jgi:hypothetical protein
LTTAAAQLRAGAPYKGLTYFSEADASFFFGREAERDLIITDLKASSLSFVYGQSGVGKSSLLRAGVAATLRSQARDDFARFGSAEFVPVVFANWRDDPLDGLAKAIAGSAAEFAVRDYAPCAGGSLVESIEAAAEATQASVLVIFDQFEEYFLYHPGKGGPGSFAGHLVEAVNCPGLPAGFLLAIRDDCLAQLDAFRGHIPKLFSSYRRVNPLTKAAATQAIVKPLEEYNRLAPPEETMTVEDGLVSTVVAQVASGQVKLDSVGAGGLDATGADAVEAPYLQLVMSRLWQEETLAGSRALRLSTLEALGGAQKIVRGHLDATLGALPPADQELAADVFCTSRSSLRCSLTWPTGRQRSLGTRARCWWGFCCCSARPTSRHRWLRSQRSAFLCCGSSTSTRWTSTKISSWACRPSRCSPAPRWASAGRSSGAR